MTTILLLDDSKTIRDILKVYLLRPDTTFLDAEEGERGLQLARLMPVDLVICDVKMPGMDGITFVKELRADPRPRVRNLPVVMLTGEKGEMISLRCMHAGATAMLQKPVQPDKLVALVQQCLAHAANQPQPPQPQQPPPTKK